MINWIKKQIEIYPKLWEIFKFLLIGGTATLIDFGIMWLFMQFVWSNPIMGTAVGFLIGLVFNYIFSIIFVYTGKGNTTEKAKTVKGFLLFLFLSAIGLGVHVVGMWLGYDILKINEWIVKIILTVVVLVFNYITRKKFIFSEKQEEEKAV